MGVAPDGAREERKMQECDNCRKAIGTVAEPICAGPMDTTVCSACFEGEMGREPTKDEQEWEVVVWTDEDEARFMELLRKRQEAVAQLLVELDPKEDEIWSLMEPNVEDYNEGEAWTEYALWASPKQVREDIEEQRRANGNESSPNGNARMRRVE